MKKKKTNWFCADFETTSYNQYLKEKETRVYLWKMINGVDNKEYIGIDINSFFTTLESLKEDVTVYFHNLSFDGEFILWYILGCGYTYSGEEGVVENGSFYTIIDETSSIYAIDVKLNNGFVVHFKCSYKLFPKSIKEIGKMVGIEKLNETHDYEEEKHFNSVEELSEEEVKYITNDVRIMVALINYLNSVGITGITMSSSAYRNWRNGKGKFWFCKQYLGKDENPEIESMVTRSYKGGITMCNPKYIEQDFTDVMSFDVNSLYPSVMYDNIMPIGNGKFFDSVEDAMNSHYYCILVEIAILNVKVRDGFHPFIGEVSGFSYSRNYQYNRTLDNRSLTLWYEEFQMFECVYEGQYEIVRIVAWKGAKNVFKDYIDKWYHIKETTENKTERSLSKLMLNSLYGKFGMNDNRITKIPVGINPHGYIMYDTDTTNSCYYAKKIASRITSLARVKLVSFLEQCEDDFLYCDTDSIYMKGHVIPKYLRAFIDDKKRGFWKYEGHYKRFRMLKAKCYMKEFDNGEIKHSIAGCPKETAEEFTWNNFKFGTKLIAAKKVKIKVRGGIVINTTSFELRSN